MCKQQTPHTDFIATSFNRINKYRLYEGKNNFVWFVYRGKYSVLFADILVSEPAHFTRLVRDFSNMETAVQGAREKHLL